MITNYLKIALRNILRRKGYSFINIAGLGLGMTCALLIFQYVAQEYSFDRFNENFTILYKVTLTGSRDARTESLAGYALGPALAQEVPEVVRFARLHPDYNDPVISSTSQPDKAFEEKRLLYADPAFLQMFSYPLILGNRMNALTESGTILISESSARRYFGRDDPMGKTLNVTGWISGIFRVNGVFKDVPVNSHLQFDFLMPMSDLLQQSGYKDNTMAWRWTNFITYVQLRPGANIPDVERKFTNVVMTHRKDDFERNKISVRVNAQPLSDVHLNGSISTPRAVVGSYQTVYFFVLIGVVTLLIALVNYVNLATARSLDRAREVGIRKVVGAQRRQLVLQFLVESTLTNLAALFVAIMAAEVLRPVVNNLAGTRLSLDLLGSLGFWAAFMVAFAIGTILAGLYPAFVLSSFRPAIMQKGTGGSSFLRLRLRQGLVVLQFAASVVLLAGTAIVYDQLDYVRHLDLGMKLDQILAVRGPSVIPKGANREAAMSTMIQQLRQIPSIGEIATTTALPGEGFAWYASGLRRQTGDPSTGVRGALARVDTGFVHLFGLTLVSGRGFEEMTAPAVQGQPVPALANETSIGALGFKSPEESLNQLVAFGGLQLKIIGVLKDFNWSSAHEKREAVLFTQSTAGDKLALKVTTVDLQRTIGSVKEIYTNLFPGNPFEYHFVDERFDEQYRNDRRFGTLFGIFAMLAILIACLGLFGLAAFTTERRTKEIGVRKVLGASVSGLVALLTKEFVGLVLVADLLAWPISYYTMNGWLQDFAYKTEIHSSTFLLAGSLALVVAFATVCIVSTRAALANPVESLRYE